MNIDFSIAKENDIEFLLVMMSDFYEHEKIQFNKEVLHSALIDIIRHPSLGKIWLINLDSEVIGYFILTFMFSMEFKGRNALLDEFYIKDSHRRKGIGKQTLEFIEQQCKLSNIQTLHLQVNKFNPSAKKLYDSFNMQTIDRIFMKKEFD